MALLEEQRAPIIARVDAAKKALSLGVNDLGGTLIEENITRESGAEYGQALTVEQFQKAITSAGRIPVQRSTTYEHISENDPRYRPPRPEDEQMLGTNAAGGKKRISLGLLAPDQNSK